jgi:sigma-B regulation protein RsbQ
MNALTRHHVSVTGRADGPAIVFAHGFGCDQHMWRWVAPAFRDDFRVVLFDHAGAGEADPAAYDEERHASLQGYADDVVEICRELGITDGVFVGHSVSSMIGVLADAAAPELFDRLVMVGPSPRYIDDEGYVGGSSEPDVRELLESLESNYLGWSSAMAPVIMGNPDRPELGQELTNSFCHTDPAIARHFAQVTFLSDNRADLAQLRVPTLILQCSDDVIAPEPVGRYVHEHVLGSILTLMQARGHCPNLSAPAETIAAIQGFPAAAAAQR